MPEALTQAQLQELTDDLRQLACELEDQLHRIDSDSQPVELDQQLVGRLSRMDAMQQQQMARASQTHMRAHLSRVRRALNDLDSGDFGYCQSCDEPIAFARLKIRPDSPLCVQCQQKNEP